MNLNRFGKITSKRAFILLGAFIVIAGFGVALVSNFPASPSASFGPAALYTPTPSGNASFSEGRSGNPSAGSDYVIVGTSSSAYSTSTAVTTTSGGNPAAGSSGKNPSSNTTGGTGSLLEFSSDLSIESPNPQTTAGQVVTMAYGAGGYVAYQSTSQSSAYVVIRVPAPKYTTVLANVEALGTFVSLNSNSNDVSVQYTDLNATLASLRTEEGALLRLLNQSASINTTLAVETQLEGVDAQINSIESQILQTKTLVSYSTISVTISQTVKTTPPAPLTIVLKAAPKNGTAPLSVTFDAIVKGGAQPYVIIINYGDGTSDQGQVLIHTYTQAGDYKVTATATDQNGTAAIATPIQIHVDFPPGQGGIGGFLGTVSNLFVNVVEGIVEVAVVVLPLAAVGAVVVLPLRRRTRAQKEIKPG
jgi:PKD repeat protein